MNYNLDYITITQLSIGINRSKLTVLKIGTAL